jgi:hypothetical protein
MNEIRQQAFQHIDLIQQHRERWYDKFIKKKQFKVGDWALLFDSIFKDFKVKFNTNGLVPMILKLYLIMDLLIFKLYMMRESPSWSMGIGSSCIKIPNLRGSLFKDIMKQV